MIYSHDRKEQKKKQEGVISQLPPVNNGGGENAQRYIAQRGLSWEIARENGWYWYYSKTYGSRVVIPAITRIPGHHYWQERAVGYHKLRYNTPKGPRRDALMHLKPLASYPFDIYKKGSLCIVEGPFDALAMSEIPYAQSVALMGTNPTPEAFAHLQSICEQGYEHIYCISDRDQPTGMINIAFTLAVGGVPVDIRVPTSGKDVASIPLKERVKLLE